MSIVFPESGEFGWKAWLEGLLTELKSTSDSAVQPAALDAAVQVAVDALVAGAPGVLDTLSELSTALGDDANFAASVSTALAARVNLDGSNLVGSGLEANLNATYASAADLAALAPSDRGEQFMAELLYGSDNIAVGIAGDSTGNAATEWAELLMADLGSDHPALRVLVDRWTDGTAAPWSDTESGDYAGPVEIQAGTEGVGGVVFDDTFTRTAADLYNTVPDLGSAWGRDGSNAAGDWSIDGTKAVRTADATTGSMLADTMTTGPQDVSISGILSTTAGAAIRQVRLVANYVDGTNHVFGQISISTSGVSTFLLVCRTDAGGVRTIQSATATGLTTNTASQEITMAVGLAEGVASATLNGQTLSGAVTSDELAALASGTKAGFNSAGWTTGDSISRFTVEITTPSAPRELTLYNASMPGSKLDYHLPRVARMFPDPLSVIFINSCHNYGADTPAQHWEKVDAFIAALRVVQPNAGIIVTSQNPRKPPASSPQHDARSAALRSYARRRWHGYIAAFEAFKAQEDGGYSLIKSDGIHPTEGATGTGSSLWRDAAKAYLESLA